METSTAISIRQYSRYLILSLGITGLFAKIIEWLNPRSFGYFLFDTLLLLFIFSSLTLSRYFLLKNKPRRQDVFLLLWAPGVLFLTFLATIVADHWR